MMDVMWATLGVAGWMVGALVLLAMALFPFVEAVEARRDRRAGRVGAERTAAAGAGR